mgnify:CR=1 FL=1
MVAWKQMRRATAMLRAGRFGDAAVLKADALGTRATPEIEAQLAPVRGYMPAVDVAALKGRFYSCDVLKASNTSQACEAKGDATLAVSTQGGVRLLRVAGGYSAELKDRMQRQRFWAEHMGTVFRGTTDLQRSYNDQRVNKPAWDALRGGGLGPAHGPDPRRADRRPRVPLQGGSRAAPARRRRARAPGCTSRRGRRSARRRDPGGSSRAPRAAGCCRGWPRRPWQSSGRRPWCCRSSSAPGRPWPAPRPRPPPGAGAWWRLAAHRGRFALQGRPATPAKDLPQAYH